MITFVLLSRAYCHLCEDMLQALRAYEPDHRFTVEVVDIDQNAELLAKYDELVPVLLASKNGKPPGQLCHYFLDEAKLKAFLSG